MSEETTIAEVLEQETGIAQETDPPYRTADGLRYRWLQSAAQLAAMSVEDALALDELLLIRDPGNLAAVLKRRPRLERMVRQLARLAQDQARMIEFRTPG